MKTVVSVLMVLAVLVLFAQIVLPRGSDASAKAAKEPGRFVVVAVSSRATVEGANAAKMAWAKNRRGHFSPVRK
jgi:hypothetical protein